MADGAEVVAAAGNGDRVVDGPERTAVDVAGDGNGGGRFRICRWGARPRRRSSPQQ